MRQPSTESPSSQCAISSKLLLVCPMLYTQDSVESQSPPHERLTCDPFSREPPGACLESLRPPPLQAGNGGNGGTQSAHRRLQSTGDRAHSQARSSCLLLPACPDHFPRFSQSRFPFRPSSSLDTLLPSLKCPRSRQRLSRLLTECCCSPRKVCDAIELTSPSLQSPPLEDCCSSHDNLRFAFVLPRDTSAPIVIRH